ncbi:10907_t:CDS:2, partial [Gigaspora margarita]
AYKYVKENKKRLDDGKSSRRESRRSSVTHDDHFDGNNQDLILSEDATANNCKQHSCKQPSCTVINYEPSETEIYSQSSEQEHMNSSSQIMSNQEQKHKMINGNQTMQTHYQEQNIYLIANDQN